MNFPELQPAPPVGFNLTFMCPEGQVCFRLYTKWQKVQQMFYQKYKKSTKDVLPDVDNTFLCPKGQVYF